MPHSTNKELILGIMVGTTGISLLLLWYHKVHKPRTTVNMPNFLSLGNTLDSIAFQDEMHNSQGSAAIFQRKQLQILEKLNEVLKNMEELKEEIRVLKETIPKLEEYIQDELGGKVTVHKISPQHRARKRKLATVRSSATSNSSEEAESEGGCCKQDWSFRRKHQRRKYHADQGRKHHADQGRKHHADQGRKHRADQVPKHRADQVPSDPQPRAPSKTCSAKRSRPKETRQPPSRRKDNSAKGNEVLSSGVSASASLSKRRRSLSLKFQKNNAYLRGRQSRANFESQEKTSLGDLKPSRYFSFKSIRLYSSPRLSMVTCYEDFNNFDFQTGSQNSFFLGEIEIISRNSRITDVQKYTSSFLPEYSTMQLMVERRVNYSSQWTSVEKSTYQQGKATFNSLPTLTSFSHESSGILSADEERDQLRKDSFHFDSQRHGTNYSTALIQQHPSQSIISPFLNVGFSSFYKNGSCFTPSQNNITSVPFEVEKLRSHLKMKANLHLLKFLNKVSSDFILSEKAAKIRDFLRQSDCSLEIFAWFS